MVLRAGALILAALVLAGPAAAQRAGCWSVVSGHMASVAISLRVDRCTGRTWVLWPTTAGERRGGASDWLWYPLKVSPHPLTRAVKPARNPGFNRARPR